MSFYSHYRNSFINCVLFLFFFVLLDVLCMLVCSILVLCMICAAEMANEDTYSGSSGMLIILVSVVVPDKLPGQQSVTKKKQ